MTGISWATSVATGYAKPLGLLFLRHSVSDSLIKIQWNPEARVDDLSFSLTFPFSFFCLCASQFLTLYWYLALKRISLSRLSFLVQVQGISRTLRIIPPNRSLILFGNKGKSKGNILHEMNNAILSCKNLHSTFAASLPVEFIAKLLLAMVTLKRSSNKCQNLAAYFVLKNYLIECYLYNTCCDILWRKFLLSQRIL